MFQGNDTPEEDEEEDFIKCKKTKMSENLDDSSIPSNSNNITVCSSSEEPQDADYSSLSYELENLIFAKFPISENWKLTFLNKRCSNLLKSGELYKIRKSWNSLEPSVFMFASGESTWWSFDRKFKSRRKLPPIPSDVCFSSGDKESLCAGTHLLVSGREIDGLVVWQYNLARNEWAKGPIMITPRCLFASARCGARAYVAGGMGSGPGGAEAFDSAERYDPEDRSWAPLPNMRKRRKFCSGFYMDGKFYVIGGRNEEEGELTCGESLDESRNRWELIPDILKDEPVQSSHSPPLLAVVNNELYSLEASSNEVKVYLKGTNSWKRLGAVPVRADYNRGWGVAFKSLGDELLIIGASSSSSSSGNGNCMAIYTCFPDLGSDELEWRLIDGGRNRLSHFILNCSVMVA